MPTNQRWFEMRDIRDRTVDVNVWIPLRSNHTLSNDQKRYFEGYEEEFRGVSSATFSLDQRATVERRIGWGSLSLMHDHAPYVQDDVYHSADIFEADAELRGLYLVLSQRTNSIEPSEWHLHPDLALGLRLKREGDVWLALEEGYIPVVRLTRNANGSPTLVEIRSIHLKDFLAARKEFLCLSTYTSREAIAADRESVDWTTRTVSEHWGSHNEWRGSITEIAEGGHEYGSSMAVFHVGRKNFYLEQDVPEIGPTDEFETHRYSRVLGKGRKLFRIWGELWKVDYVNPGPNSVRVRGDDVASMTYFFTDGSGAKESAEELDRKGRWLWFNPDIINKALEFRGSFLEWYTADTGRISMGPDGGVHFGVNQLGMVNVYAKDIRYASAWQQQIWAGFNTIPDGGVSKELLMAQAEGQPADTQAPEAFLEDGIRRLNQASEKKFGVHLVRPHDEQKRLLRASHRFRAKDEHGFLQLAKDLARILIDGLDTGALKKIMPPPQGETRGSLKSLEAILAANIGAETARSFMSPMFGLYELRNADAHLPPSELGEAYSKMMVNAAQPWVHQGAVMLSVIVEFLHRTAEVIENGVL